MEETNNNVGQPTSVKRESSGRKLALEGNFVANEESRYSRLNGFDVVSKMIIRAWKGPWFHMLHPGERFILATVMNDSKTAAR